MKEKARVIKIDKEKVIVRTEPGERCTKCCSCAASESRDIEIKDSGTQNFVEGEKVEVEVEDAGMMKVYCFIYALPLLVFLALILLTYKITGSALAGLIVSFTGVLAIYAFLRAVLKRKDIFPSLKLAHCAVANTMFTETANKGTIRDNENL